MADEDKLPPITSPSSADEALDGAIFQRPNAIDGAKGALSKLAASAAAGRKAYDAVFHGRGPLEAAAASRATSGTPPVPSDGQRTEMATEPPIRVEPSNGQPMHPRDKRLFVFL